MPAQTEFLYQRSAKLLSITKEIIIKYCHFFQINPIHKNFFDQNPIIAYRRIRNFRDLIGSNSILRVVHKNIIKKKQLYCSPCYTRKDNLCSQKVIKINYLQVTKVDEH